ncbi:unnamed protein product [Vitrella brassicaformis CCMP3155]|uniref:Glycosyl transferase 64 domain-containing protein n=2 Tax=Vitrella brassicaformis TaxID=1169539 RepID=A0A0G4EDZ4_VITBC|nr:unnamed protein product [Vitrella brassicaformis CCMP3155]|eukprot:CEL94200.1 unnamed protein product [Vitrella brassicaformis CCMP3155]
MLRRRTWNGLRQAAAAGGDHDFSALRTVTLDQWVPDYTGPGRCRFASHIRRKGSTGGSTTLTLGMNDTAIHDLQGSVTVAVRMGPFRALRWIMSCVKARLEDCSFVREIVLDVWTPPGKSLEAFRNELHNHLRKVNTTKARILPGDRGLGERYFVGEHIQTPFTLVLDDDKLLHCAEIHKLLLAAQRFPQRIIGPVKVRRSIHKCVIGSDTLLYPTERQEDNMALTSAALVPTSLMDAYRRLIPRPVIDFINGELNCEDVCFNWLAAHLNGDEEEACVIVEDVEVKEGPQGNDALTKSHNSWGRRNACLNFLRDVFPQWPIPRPSSFRVRIE